MEGGSWARCLIPSAFVINLMSLLVALIPLVIDDPSPCSGIGKDHWSGAGIFLLVVGVCGNLILTVLSFGSWLRTTSTDPGCPPQSREEISIDLHPNRDQYPICDRCHLVKLPRTHHCSICQRCTLRYDHHCPWVNNCVGLHNHKFFILFTFWTSVLCLFQLAILLARYAVVGWDFCLIDIGVLPTAVLTVLGGSFTFGMAANHVVLLYSGATTLEYTASVSTRYLQSERDRLSSPRNPPRNPSRTVRHYPPDYYSLGCWANTQTLMGSSICCMLCPFQAPHMSDAFPHPRYDEERA